MEPNEIYHCKFEPNDSFLVRCLLLYIQRQEHDPHEKAVRLTARERRFIKFASVEFDGQLYMTPQDFLDSVVEQEPRPRLKRKMLSPHDIDQIKDQTPALKNGSSSLFRSLRDKGMFQG